METEIEIDVGNGDSAESSKTNKIVMLRLYSGDFIVGELDPFCDGDTVSLINPRSLVMVPTMAGDVRMGFQVVIPFSEKYKKEIAVHRNQIMATVESDELGKELINAYNSHVTGIKIASASQSAAINGGGDIIL